MRSLSDCVNKGVYRFCAFFDQRNFKNFFTNMLNKTPATEAFWAAMQKQTS